MIAHRCVVLYNYAVLSEIYNHLWCGRRVHIFSNYSNSKSTAKNTQVPIYPTTKLIIQLSSNIEETNKSVIFTYTSERRVQKLIGNMAS